MKTLVDALIRLCNTIDLDYTSYRISISIELTARLNTLRVCCTLEGPADSCSAPTKGLAGDLEFRAGF